MSRYSRFLASLVLVFFVNTIATFTVSNNFSGRMNSLEQQFEEDLQNLPQYDPEFESRLSLLISSANDDEMALSFIFNNALSGSLFEILREDEGRVEQQIKQFKPEEDFKPVTISINDEITVEEEIVLEDLEERDMAEDIVKIEIGKLADEFAPVQVQVDEEFVPVESKEADATGDEDEFRPAGSEDEEMKELEMELEESTLEADLNNLKIAVELASEEVQQAENQDPAIITIGDAA